VVLGEDVVRAARGAKLGLRHTENRNPYTLPDIRAASKYR
jgi:hypothetical protein